MEILSDATFKGNVRVNGGTFSVTHPGECSPLLETINSSNDYGFKVYTSEYIHGLLKVVGDTFFEGGVYVDNYIKLGPECISSWSDLNSKLSFAPASLSSTVSTLCTKVNSLCTTVSSNTTRINSVCSAVSSLPKFCSVTLDFDVPADCTKFLIETNTYPTEAPYYMFMTKGHNPMSVVNVDLESRCDSTTDMHWKFIATKSSGFAMNASDDYKLGYFYKC